MSAWNEPELHNSTLKCNFCDQLKFDMTLRYFFFFNCVKNHKMPAAFQLRVILITVVLFISMPNIITIYECYFFFEFAKCRAHSRTHDLMFEYAN